MNTNINNIIGLFLCDDRLKSATKYITPKAVIRVSRRVYKSHRKTDPIELLISFTKPNYKEREFIKLCKKAKEPFPVKKLQVKYIPIKK